jgi:hypothetical protein
MPDKCPQCGATLPAGALAGLCPACLLQQGAAPDTATRSNAKPFVPPSIEEVARLFPQLEILGFLGKGGMGAVYKGRQPALDRLVALKILPAQAAPDPGFAERFSREARALARLSHPNIVAVHEFGQVSGAGETPAGTGGTPALPYFIMEFVDGVNLRQLQKAGRLSPREALQIVPQICDALQYAHDEGVVHRDIKPENVLVDRKGRVKIADFGLAKILGCDPEALRLTGEGQVMGTPHYMAPEQFERPLTVDHRADIFSLGVVFYEMLTGELPLGKFQPPSRKVQVDVRLDDVVLHALEKEPERRYQHVSEVKTAVETISGTTHSGPAASARPKATAEAPREMVGASRLSRTALVGVIWAQLAFLAFLGFSYSYRGPTWWQILMEALLLLWLTAPFGTTLLGWVAIAQIRRSGGRLYGVGLAFLDGMLFPLLALAGLLAWGWWWFYSDALMRLIMIDSGPPGTTHVISAFHAFILHHVGALTVLVAVASSVSSGFFLIRWAWRKVRTPLSGEPGQSAGQAALAGTTPLPAGVRVWRIATAVILAVVALNCVIAVLALRPAFSKSRAASNSTPGPTDAFEAGPTNPPSGLASLPASGSTRTAHVGGNLSSLLQFRCVAADGDTASPADDLDDPADPAGRRRVRVLRSVLLDGSAIARAGYDLPYGWKSEGGTILAANRKPQPDSQRCIELDLTLAGGRAWEEITATNLNRQIAIVFRGQVLSLPVIRTSLPGAHITIKGPMSASLVREVVATLNVGLTGTPKAWEFSEPIEVTLSCRPDLRSGVDLATGRCLTNSNPARSLTRDDPFAIDRAMHEWMLVNGLDLTAFSVSATTYNLVPCQLATSSLFVQGASETALQTITTNAYSITAADVVYNWDLMTMDEQKSGIGFMFLQPSQPQQLNLFRTRKGCLGILEVLKSANTRAVRVRYKRVQSAVE